MKESGSKRPAASSPTRQVKRHRNIKPDNESPEGDSKKVQEKNLKVRPDEGITKKNSKRKDSSKITKDKDDGKPKLKESNKSDKANSESDYEHYTSDEAGPDQKQSKGSRYWGGDEEKPNLEDGELSNHSQDPVEYEVGQRYYTSVADDKEKEKSKIEIETEFVVGKRYYDDGPDKPSAEIKNENDKAEANNTKPVTAPTRRAKDDPLLSRTGGAYIPPAKLRLMQASITDKSSVSYQRIAWEALKKSIHGHINKVNTSNIGIIARLLMKENIVRGRGLLSRSLLQAQAASPTFTNVYACLVSIINSKFPNIGELLMKRVILQFKRGFKRNDKALCISSCQFIAHLVNQQVAHEIVALEMLTLLLESPTDDSVEVAVAFLKEVGQKLLELSPKGTNAIFDMLRNILHQGNLEKRVQYMIEVVFQVRKDGFRSFESVAENLDLVEEEDRFTHILTLDEAVDPEDMLNVFKHDTEYELNENKYKALKEEIIGESSSEEESGDEGSDEDSEEEGSEEDDDDEGEAKESKEVTIKDATETNLVALRRTIYLTIQSSLDFEECCHKLLKMDIKPGQEPELCHMLLDCCAELRTYEKFFGLLAQRFCQINRVYIAPLEEMFAGSYATVHRLDTNKLRNVARFFGHLLFTDAISWTVLETVKLNEEDTTSSSRIFIKILFQELAEYLGLAVLNQRLKDPTLQSAMEGLFPRDNPKNTRFAINFFTSIGLGGLTDDLREHLKTQPKPSAVAQLVEKLELSSDSSSSSSDSSDDTSDSESSDESSDSEDDKKKKKNTKKEKRQTNKNSSELDTASKTDKKDKGNDKRRRKSSEIEEQQRKVEQRKVGQKDERLHKHDKNKEDKSWEKEQEKKSRDKLRERERHDRESVYSSNRDKGNYKEEKHERENYKNKNAYKERHDKDMGRQDYDRNEDRNKRQTKDKEETRGQIRDHKEETKGKIRDHKEDTNKYRDKENKKKECKKNEDIYRDRVRRNENKYREEKTRKFFDDDGAKKRKDDYESSRSHKERSHRKHR